MFEGNIIDQLTAAVEAVEARLRWQAARTELAGESPVQAAGDSSTETLLAGVA